MKTQVSKWGKDDFLCFPKIHANNQFFPLGDLSQQVAIRERLKCHNFQWFMEKVAYDQDKHYPAVIPTPYAKGSIKSQADPRFCVEASFTNK